MGAKLKIKRDTSLLDAATTLDIHVQTLRDYLKKGAPCEKRNGQYFLSLPELASWMKVNSKTGDPGRPAMAGSRELVAAKVKTQLWLARRYQLEVERLEREGKTYPLSAVKDMFVEHAGIVKAALESLPGLTTLWGLPPDKQARIQSDLQRFVDDVYRHLQSYAQTTEKENGASAKPEN
jgi:hypothetical protein